MGLVSVPDDAVNARPNKALHATATVLGIGSVARKHNTVVAVASALPVAVRELGRWAACCVYDSASIH